MHDISLPASVAVTATLRFAVLDGAGDQNSATKWRD